MEDVVDARLLPLVAPEEGDLLRVVHQVRLGRTVLPLQTLLPRDQLPEGRRDELQEHAREEVPGDDRQRPRPPHDLGQLAREEDDVEGGLGEVGVDGGEGIGPLLDVGSEPLVGVADATVQVAQLVEDHVAQVRLVEELREPGVCFEVRINNLSWT